MNNQQVPTIQLTPGQQFAQEYGNGAVAEMLKTIAWAKRLALFVVVAVMVVSYQHQQHYLLSIHTDMVGAWIIPIIIDALTLLCVKVLSATGMAKTAKMIALSFMLFPIGASAWINFNGSPNHIVGWIYVIVVAFIAVAEVIKAFIRPDFDSILTEESRVQTARRIGRKLTEQEKAERKAKADATRAARKQDELKELARQRRVAAKVRQEVHSPAKLRSVA